MIKFFILLSCLILIILFITYFCIKLLSIRYRVVEVNDNNAEFRYVVQKHLSGLNEEWFTISRHHTKEEAMSEFAWFEEINNPPKVKVLKEIWT